MTARAEVAQLPILDQSSASRIESQPLGRHVLVMIGAWIAVSLDNLRSALIPVRWGELPTYGPFTNVRTAHEAAVHALWMLDGAIDDSHRVARGCVAFHHDLEERRKFESAINRPKPQVGKLACERIADLLAEAEAVGLAVNGKFIEPRLTTEVLFDRYAEAVADPNLPPSLYWRLLSALAHGRSWPQAFLDTEMVAPASHGRTGIQSVQIDEALLLVVAFRATDSLGWQ